MRAAKLLLLLLLKRDGTTKNLLALLSLARLQNAVNVESSRN